MPHTHSTHEGRIPSQIAMAPTLLPVIYHRQCGNVPAIHVLSCKGWVLGSGLVSACTLATNPQGSTWSRDICDGLRPNLSK
eukprot:1707673-Amphidinium_carterae.1